MEKSFWGEWKFRARGIDGEITRLDLREFISQLVATLSHKSDIEQPAVVSHGFVVYLTSSVSAETETEAVEKLRRAFSGSITEAGGTSDLEDGSADHTLQLHELEGSVDLEKIALEVRELVPA